MPNSTHHLQTTQTPSSLNPSLMPPFKVMSPFHELPYVMLICPPTQYFSLLPCLLLSFINVLSPDVGCKHLGASKPCLFFLMFSMTVILTGKSSKVFFFKPQRTRTRFWWEGVECKVCRILVHRLGFKLTPPAVDMTSPNHQTAKDVPLDQNSPLLLWPSCTSRSSSEG